MDVTADVSRPGEIAPILEREVMSDPLFVRTCILILYCRPKPSALIQIAPWLGLGGGWRGSRALATFSVGTDATVTIVKLFQPPRDDYGGKLILRLGPWIGVETPLNRMRGEGGLSLALRQEHREGWGSTGLRGGVGVDTHGAAYWVASASWGIYGERLGDDGCWGACEQPPAPRGPATFGLADGARFFISLRRAFEQPSNEWTFGLEFQPAWFWPLPSGYEYTRWRRH